MARSIASQKFEYTRRNTTSATPRRYAVSRSDFKETHLKSAASRPLSSRTPSGVRDLHLLLLLRLPFPQFQISNLKSEISVAVAFAFVGTPFNRCTNPPPSLCRPDC